MTQTYLPDSVTEIEAGDQLSHELASTPLANIGVRAGASLATALRDGRSGLLRIDGDVLSCAERATRPDPAALDL